MAIKDFNEARRQRSMSERRFTLGPYTFSRRPTIPPEVLSQYANAGNDGDDTNTIQAFEAALLQLVEKKCTLTATGQEIMTADAWHVMRTEGDENDVISFEDLAAITSWLVEGVVERPTGQPSDSLDGSVTPDTGMISTPSSLSEAPILTPSTPAAPATPSMRR